MERDLPAFLQAVVPLRPEAAWLARLTAVRSDSFRPALADSADFVRASFSSLKRAVSRNLSMLPSSGDDRRFGLSPVPDAQQVARDRLRDQERLRTHQEELQREKQVNEEQLAAGQRSVDSASAADSLVHHPRFGFSQSQWVLLVLARRGVRRILRVCGLREQMGGGGGGNKDRVLLEEADPDDDENNSDSDYGSDNEEAVHYYNADVNANVNDNVNANTNARVEEESFRRSHEEMVKEMQVREKERKREEDEDKDDARPQEAVPGSVLEDDISISPKRSESPTKLPLT
jgi:hypothetical protein